MCHHDEAAPPSTADKPQEGSNAIMTQRPPLDNTPPPTPAGVAILMSRTSASGFVGEVAGLIEHIADLHATRCDTCELIEGPCALIEFANTVSIAWLMEQVPRG